MDPRPGVAPLLNFRAAPEDVQLLDDVAARTGRTRSDLMRTALSRYLHELEEAPQASCA
jgi:predicted DNA-binding protein